jgi:hypothetical protein
VGYSVPLGLLIAGVSISAGMVKLLPKCLGALRILLAICSIVPDARTSVHYCQMMGKADRPACGFSARYLILGVFNIDQPWHGQSQ